MNEIGAWSDATENPEMEPDSDGEFDGHASGDSSGPGRGPPKRVEVKPRGRASQYVA